MIAAIAREAALKTFVAGTVLLACVAAASRARAQDGGDAAMGARLFLQCRACHTVGAGEPGGVGPNLYGAYGAAAAARPGYAYSPALSGSGLTWSADNLDAWLRQPGSLVPGTRMAFAGVKSDKARADLIAYLATLRPGVSP